MNLLELVQDLAAETGTVSPSEISDVKSPENDHVADLVRWIIRSNHEIELERDDWRWRIKEGELEITAEEDVTEVGYQITDFHKIIPYRQPWRMGYVTVDREYFPVRYVRWPVWTGDYDVRVARTQPSRPIAWTMDPQEHVRTYPVPNHDITLRFNYSSEAQVMKQVNDCEPRMPERFHRVIVYHAMIWYAMHDEAQFQFQSADRRYRRMRMKLNNDQLHGISVVN